MFHFLYIISSSALIFLLIKKIFSPNFIKEFNVKYSISENNAQEVKYPYMRNKIRKT